MFGGKWMDTFMDKIAQKFTAGEIIKANSAADAEQLQRLQQQVKKYDDCLAEMKQVNQSLEAVIASGVKKFETAEINTDKLNELIEVSMNKINELQKNTDNIEELLKPLITEQCNQISEYVHKENVKVYRNVQAVVVDELAKQTDHIDHSIQNSDKKSIAILVFTIF